MARRQTSVEWCARRWRSTETTSGVPWPAGGGRPAWRASTDAASRIPGGAPKVSYSGRIQPVTHSEITVGWTPMLDGHHPQRQARFDSATGAPRSVTAGVDDGPSASCSPSWPGTPLETFPSPLVVGRAGTQSRRGWASRPLDVIGISWTRPSMTPSGHWFGHQSWGRTGAKTLRGQRLRITAV